MTAPSSTTEHVERALDDALEMTFPASDPVAVFVPEDSTRRVPSVPAARRSLRQAT